MKCRKNIRRLIQEYNATLAADRPTTQLARFVATVVALKSAPSRLPAPHTQANRYDDYVYVHQQSMAGHPNGDPGPHPGHKGPLFFPWHREFLRQFELDLRAVSGDPNMCLPYWDFSRDQSPADAGYPFIVACLGGDGTGPNDTVTTGPFIPANGFSVAVGGGGVTALQRELGQDPIAPTLPSKQSIRDALAVSVYDAPNFDWNAPAASSFRNLVEGWSGPDIVNVHNRVHVWVGGSMGPSTSPNDPVFFLNHAKEDQLWAVWAQKYPSVPHYLPDDGYSIPAAQHHLKRLSDHMDSLAVYFGAGTIDRPVDLLSNKAITWYDTDLPDVTLESGPALAFHDTPAGLTVAKLIRLRIHSCQPLVIRMTGAPTGNFSVVGGPSFPVTPLEANASELLEIEVRFVGQGPNVQVSAVEFNVEIVDDEGYYSAAEGDTYLVQKLRVELVASNIVTSDSSVVLVLDRSGSMADVANSGLTKASLLRSAVGVVHELMKDTDEIGIARFDHEADVLLGMTPKSAGLGTALTGPGLDPRGATSIGAGILHGSGLINGPTATRPNKAMIVLTDGNENWAPLISALPGGTISQTTFAIGLGLPGQVSDPILSQIAANTGGYLLVTGDVSSNTERFALAKFFIQVLKDATLNQTIIDPEGHLLWNGPPQEIPFQVSDADVSIDVVALCPVPWVLDFDLVTPSGQVLTSAIAAAEPNISYRVGADVAYYRVLLPALPGNPGGSHRGTWKARLRLMDIKEISQRLREALKKDQRDEVLETIQKLQEFARGTAPYNLSVHSYSNLTLDATLRLDGFAPGSDAHLTAKLWEYRLPLAAEATVWADVQSPDGSRASLPFARTAAGEYEASWHTTRPGVHRFLVHAEGRTVNGAQFTREKILTAGVWAGGNQTYDPQTGGGPGKDDNCRTLLCLLEHALESQEFAKRITTLGVDLQVLHRAVEACCKRTRIRPEDWEGRPRVPSFTVAHAPELLRLVTTLASSALASPAPVEAAKTRPVTVTQKKPGSDDNIFIRPDDRRKVPRSKKKG